MATRTKKPGGRTTRQTAPATRARTQPPKKPAPKKPAPQKPAPKGPLRAAAAPKPSDTTAGAAPAATRARDPNAPIRMGELARRSGVPASTIKHYLHEGLLPDASVSKMRNSALYDPSLVQLIVEIKELQTAHFLPLWRIKEVLQGKADRDVATVSAAVDRVVSADVQRRVPLDTLLRQGLAPEEFDALVRARLLSYDDVLAGDDLALAETIIEARRAGLTDHLSAVEVIARYVDNVTRLVEDEIAIFRDTILSGAGSRLADSTVDAMRVSERLVVLLRRRLLLPTFERTMARAALSAPLPAPRPPRN